MRMIVVFHGVQIQEIILHISFATQGQRKEQTPIFISPRKNHCSSPLANSLVISNAWDKEKTRKQLKPRKFLFEKLLVKKELDEIEEQRGGTKKEKEWEPSRAGNLGEPGRRIRRINPQVRAAQAVWSGEPRAISRICDVSGRANEKLVRRGDRCAAAAIDSPGAIS